MLKKARENATRENVEITFIKEDIVNLSFESTFDAVCSNTALEFMGNKELAIRLMLKSVKEGGSFVVGTINKESSWYEFYEAELKKKIVSLLSLSMQHLFLLKKWKHYVKRIFKQSKRDCLFRPISRRLLLI